VEKILIDAGPLIALFDKSDTYHLKSIDFIKRIDSNLWTTWAVITEVCHMLDFSAQAQINFLTWIDRGALNIFQIEPYHLDRIIALTSTFDDVPMDLADASLILASEELACNEIASVDGECYIYRNIRKQYLNNIFL